jgi:hypothetical protein
MIKTNGLVMHKDCLFRIALLRSWLHHEAMNNLSIYETTTQNDGIIQTSAILRKGESGQRR